MTCMAKRRVELDQWVNSDEQTWVSSCERQGLEELAKRLPAGAGVYVRFFPRVDPQVESARNRFLSRVSAWSGKYLR